MKILICFFKGHVPDHPDSSPVTCGRCGNRLQRNKKGKWILDMWST